jgi:hypothetical protein
MGGYSWGSAFDSKSGQMIMVALLLMVGSFYSGTLFGNNNASIYVSQLSSSSNSSSSHGMFSLSLSCKVLFYCDIYAIFCIAWCFWRWILFCGM